MIRSEEVYRFPTEMCKDENPWGDTVASLPRRVKLGYIVGQQGGGKASCRLCLSMVKPLPLHALC